MTGIYNNTYFDKLPVTPIGSYKWSGGTEPFETIFHQEYQAAHIHKDGSLGISGICEKECRRHAKLYGGTVTYGWACVEIEQA